MNFAFTEEQEELRETARAFLAEHSGPSDPPRHGERARLRPAVWKQIGAELGWTAVTIPEAYGGLGLGAVELVALLEIDRRGAAVRAVLLDRLPRRQRACSRRERRPEGGAGSRDRRGRDPRDPGVAEANGSWDPDPWLHAVARRARGDDFVLRRHQALRARRPLRCDLLLVVARRDAEDVRGGAAVDPSSPCPPDAPGLTRSAPLPTMDPTRRLADLALRRRPGSGVARCSAREGDCLRPRCYRRPRSRAAVALAAEQVGGAQRCLDLSVAYAKEREQFGRPIGSFQAIKHKPART